MKFEFTIPGKPTGKGRPRFTKNGHAFTPEATANYENLVKVCFYEQNRADEPIKPIAPKTPIVAMITAYYPIPQSTSKKQRDRMAAALVFPTVKPDTDNIAKCILDALNGIAYYDDAQIMLLIVWKRYSDEPRVSVKIMDYAAYLKICAVGDTT